ncbi:hypothetical protein Tco_0511544 [Tanacetum coccineum]
MASTKASISKASKRPKINIIPPKQLFVDLTQDDTKTPSPKLQLSSPSAPNAPSKTPSTKDTSSSSIDYIPKSPTSSTSLSPNGYLNPPTSPPPRVSPPPPTQENASMDITLTLSPITPLDVQFDTPSPSPPIFGHPIPWNLLEAHGDSYFGKHFVPQQELSTEQAFWLQTSHHNTDQSTTSPVKIKAPMELLKLSLVNTSLKKLKDHLRKFNTVVKKQIIPDAITEGEWGFEHTKKVFNEEVIPFKNSLQTLVKDVENGLLNEFNEVKMMFNQMEAAVDQCSVHKKLFEIEKKELKLENERLSEHIICQDVVNIVMHADVKSDNVLPAQNTFLDDNIALDVLKMENDHLMELLISQDLVHTAVNSLATINDYKMISPVGYKLDLVPVSSKLKNNKEAHVDYIKITKANADTLRDIVEQARTANPLDNALAYACMYTKQIQDLLVYVSDTCPSSPLKSKKLVAVTPMNKTRKVTFAKISDTSENKTQAQVDLHKTQTTNKPLVPSTNVKCSTNARRSKPQSEIKNTRILQTSSSNQKYQRV